MSAFVVEDAVINRVATALFADQYIARDIRALEIDTRAGLAEAMFTLNVNAVEQRYGKGEAASFRPLNFAYQPIAARSNYEVLKSLSCWLYQCAEGDVPDTSKLFQLMEEIKGRLAYRIVSDSPQYNAAEGW